MAQGSNELKTAPQRQCAVCFKKEDKDRLLRIAIKDKTAMIDLNHTMPGRGVYLHKGQECREKIFSSKKVYRRIIKLVNGNEAVLLALK